MPRIAFDSPLHPQCLKWGLLFVALSIGLVTLAQTAPRLEGTVVDATNGQGLPGAAVILGSSTALSDVDGKFNVVLDFEGNRYLRVRYVGYLEWTDTLDAWQGSRTLDIALEPDVARIGTAVISAGRFEQDLGEVSVSIDVLPPELVNQGAPTSADQSLSRTPGVTIVDSEPCLLYTSPSPRDLSTSRMPSSA